MGIFSSSKDAPAQETREALRVIAKLERESAKGRLAAALKREQQEQNPLPKGWRF